MKAHRILLAAVLAFTGSTTVWAAETTDATNPPPQLRIVVFPFQNASGNTNWDDWRHALPANVRLCLGAAEFTEVWSGPGTRSAIDQAGGASDGAVDASLAGRIARDLEADAAVWG